MAERVWTNDGGATIDSGLFGRFGRAGESARAAAGVLGRGDRIRPLKAVELDCWRGSEGGSAVEKIRRGSPQEARSDLRAAARHQRELRRQSLPYDSVR